MNRRILFCLVVSFLSCQHHDLFPDNPTYACDKIVTTHSQAVKTELFYSKAIDRYYIKGIYLNSPKSTTDSTNDVVSIFCNLPDDYKIVGKIITFDGSFAPILDTTGREGLVRKPSGLPISTI